MFFETEPQSLLAIGKLCPNQRRMPKLGSVLGETVAGTLLFLRLPINAVFIFPAIFSSSDWDRITDCMPVTYQHSLLLNCGKDILNIDTAFDAWNRAAFLFANALVAVLQMTNGIIGLAGTGLFMTALGVAKGSAQINTRQKSAAPAGVQGTMDQADVGNKLSKGSNSLAFTLPPWLRQYAVMFLGAAGGFQVFLHFLENLIINYIIKLGHGKKLETSFFALLYDLSRDIDELIVQNINGMCDGFSLIYGYTNPIATVLRHTCRSGAGTITSLLNIMNVFFVDYPVLNCVCQSSQGTPFQQYIQDRCYSQAPNHYRPLLNMMVQQGFGSQKATCELVVKMSNDHLTEAIYPLTTELDKALSAVGSSVDYLLFMLDPQSGTCSNYYTSDYVIAIVPDPTDYFFACGSTQMCRTRCLDEFSAFEAERDLIAGSGKDLTFTSQSLVTFESMFFSQDDILNGRNRAPFETMALIELSGCKRICYGSIDVTSSFSQPDRCFMASGVNANLQLEFRAYCLPADPRIGIYESATITDINGLTSVAYTMSGSESWTGDMYRLYFLSRDHLDTLGKRNLLVVAFRDKINIIEDGFLSSTIFEVSSKGAVPMDAIDDMFVMAGNTMSYVFVKGTRKATTLDTTVGVEVKETVEVCAVIRFETESYVMATFGKSNTYSVRYCSSRENVFENLKRYYLVCAGLECDNVLAIPMNNGYSVKTCTRPIYDFLQCTDIESDPVTAYQSTVASDIGLQDQGSRIPIWLSQDNIAIRRSQKLSQSCLVNTTNVNDITSVSILMTGSVMTKSNWISDVRLDVSGAKWMGQQSSSTVYTMNMTLVSTCSVRDCTGCRGYMQLQRMCYAAAQCAVAKCIGTTINFQRPLCAVGNLLEQLLRTSLLQLQNTYLIVTDVMKIAVNGSTGQIRNQLEITFPEEAFFSTVCQSKDILIDSVGLLMSTINGIVMKTKQALDASSTSLSPADDRFNARITLISSAMTSMFSQFLMLPLYLMIATQKTISCTANSLFAVMNLDALGNFQLTIGSATQNNQSAQVAGMCMTELVNQDTQNIGFGNTAQSLKSTVTQLVNNLYTAFKLFPMEPVVHNIDASLTYAVGVLNGMMDVIQVIDEQNCKLPDLTATDLGKCACNDKGHKIVSGRRSEGVNQMAFWCTGVLQIIKSNGKPKYIFNPYTYDELSKVMSVSMDDYLSCLATQKTSCSSLKPRMTQISVYSQDRLEYQGVDVATVFSRCRSNYVNKMWDIGAQQIMNIANQKDLKPHQNWINQYLNLDLIPQTTKECFNKVLNYGTSNDVCLQDYLTSINTKRTYYFMYEITNLDSATASISEIDACEVFTGPASNPSASVLFKQCVTDNGIDDNCVLPHYIWSGRTTNKVPVSNDHGVSYPIGSEDLFKYIDRKMATIRNDIVNYLIQPEILNWQNDQINTEIFSMEKDILHQMFDCLMIGPYASADFWPTGAQGMLPTMKYYRKTEDSREFEMPSPDCVPGVDSCCPQQSPYSCGGPARRAIIHTFVHRMKADTGVAKSVIQDEVRKKISQLTSLFASKAAYGCDCVDGDFYSTGVDVRCCKGKDVSQFASTSMQQMDFDIIGSDNISAAMFDEIQSYVHDSIWNNETLYTNFLPGWEPADFQRAEDEGFFDAQSPILNYDFHDVARPKVNDTLWKFCTAIISQAFFTLPLSDDLKGLQYPTNGGFQFEPVKDPSSGFVTGMQEAVDHILSKAREKSPFYRHFNSRYMPSKSRMCKDKLTELKSSTSSSMTSETGDTIDLGGSLNVDTPASPSLRYFGRYDKFEFRDYHRRCFCNWHLSGVCKLPTAVCADVNVVNALNSGVSQGSIDRFNSICSSDNGYYTTVDDLKVVIDVATGGWSVDWECDEMMLSDHWGIVDNAYIGEWMGGTDHAHYNWRDFLVQGPGGLRIGNLEYSNSNIKAIINPSRRDRKIYNSRNNASIALEHCIDENDVDKSTNGWKDFVGDVNLVHDYFIDNLFPIAQSVYTSGIEAFCTRWVIELARLRALEYVDAIRNYQDPTPETATQRIIVDQWRQRCVTQVKSIGLCHIRGVYHSEGNQSYSHCPFILYPDQMNQYFTHWYVTPGCLVYADGTFVDPCKCSPNADDCNYLVSIDRITSGSCDLNVDPRSFVDQSDSLYSSLHWPSSFLGEEVHDILSTDDMMKLAAQHESYMKAYVNDFPLSDRDLDDIRSYIQGDSKAEGFMFESYCDVMLDYWPKDWVHPVGYHVSTVCTQEDTAYRGYDGWMRVEYNEITKVKHLVLESSRLRNSTLSSNYFGALGVCDTSNYGMPLYEINNMRLQTRWRDNQLCDPTQPLICNVSNDEDYVVSTVSDSLLDIPMYTDENSSVLDKSLGLLKHWYIEHSGVWPKLFDAASVPKYRLSNQQSESTTEWGSNCGVMDVFKCKSDSDCNHQRTSTNTLMKCLKPDESSLGVCFKSTEIECYQHRHCSNGEMCDGSGRCVKPFVGLENELPDYNIEFNFNSDSCNVEVLGTSPWQNVPDFLHRSGLCSFRDWYESTNFRVKAGMSGSLLNGQIQELGSRDLNWVDTSPYVSLEESQIPIFDRDIMKMAPHTCDRDYAYSFKSCSDQDAWKLRDDGSYDQVGLEKGNTTRTYVPTYSSLDEINGWNLQMCKLPYMDTRPRVGFLSPYSGPGTTVDSFVDITSRIKMCSEFNLCYLQQFYVEGYKVENRKIRRQLLDGSTAIQPYTIQDVLQCGSVGNLYLEGLTTTQVGTREACVIDPLVIPFVKMFCDDTNTYNQLKEACDIDPVIDSQKIQFCPILKNRYFYTKSTSLVDQINEFIWTVFVRGFSTWQQYQKRVQCINFVYLKMTSMSDSLSNEDWYNPEVDPGVFQKMQPYRTLYAFSQNGLMEIPFKWWVKCVILDETVDISPLINQNIRGIDFITCNGWNPRVSPVTVKDILKQSDALYEDQVTSQAEALDVALRIYDSLNDVLENIITQRKAQMPNGLDDGLYKMSYYELRKIITANDFYRTDASYGNFVKSSTVPTDRDTIISKTIPVAKDDGNFPYVEKSKSIFDYVKNYMLHTDITTDYYSQVNDVPTRYSRAQMTFSVLLDDPNFLNSEIGTFYSAENGILYYRFNGFQGVATDDEIEAQYSKISSLFQETPFIDVSELDPDDSIYDAYASSVLDVTNGVRSFKPTKCLYSNVFGEGFTDNSDKDANIKLCDETGQNCRYLNVCPNSATYDSRTGQSCNIQYKSQDDKLIHLYDFAVRYDVYEYDFHYQRKFVQTLVAVPNTFDFFTFRRGAFYAFGLDPVSVTVDNPQLPVCTKYGEGEYCTTPKTTITDNPADKICLRVDSNCLGNSSISVDVAYLIPGTELQAFYRSNPLNKNPNDPSFYSKIRQTNIAERDSNLASYYPAWIDCPGAFGETKGERMISEFALTEQRINESSFYKFILSTSDYDKYMYRTTYINNNQWGLIIDEYSDGNIIGGYQYAVNGYTNNPENSEYFNLNDNTILKRYAYNNAIWVNEADKPLSHLTTCSWGGDCPLKQVQESVFSIAARLSDVQTFFCAENYDKAVAFCPGSSTGDALVTEIYKNYYYCMKNCTKSYILKYQGRHSYYFRGLKNLINFEDITVKSSEDKGFTFRDAFKMLHDLVLTDFNNLGGVYNVFSQSVQDTIWVRPSSTSSLFMQPSPKYDFNQLNILPMVNYDEEANNMKQNGVDFCTGNSVDYLQCNNDMHSTLRECNERLKTQTNYIANAKERLLWQTTKEQLTSKHTFFWTDAYRTQRDQYLDWVTSSSRCVENTQTDAVCFKYDNGFVQSINPWLAGDFNFYEGCDVTIPQDEFNTVIDSFCPAYFGANCENYNLYLEQTTCIAKNNRNPARTDVRVAAKNNLCKQGIRDNTTCIQHQNVFGGGSGQQMEDLYVRPTTEMVYTGLFGSNPNPAYQKDTTEYVLKESIYDIGGTLVVATLQRTNDTVGNLIDDMQIRCLPLHYEKDAMDRPLISDNDLCQGKSKQYLLDYIAERISDITINNIQVGSKSFTNDVDWSCPIKEQEFWSGKNPNFRPVFPYGKRASVMFGGINIMGDSTLTNKMSNPVQFGGQEMYHLADAMFISEICSCWGDLSSCSQCNLQNTVDFLFGDVWKIKSHYTSNTCQDSLDWPSRGGTLRDGSVLPDNLGTTTSDCNINERLRRYEVRYNTIPFSASRTAEGKTTLDEGGVCHMGVLPMIPSTVPVGARCARHNSTTLKCIDSSTSNQAVEYIHLTIPSSATVEEQISRSTSIKRRCSSCHGAPKVQSTFVRTVGDQVTAEIQEDELSVGIPVRIATARMMAMDLRRHICGDSPSCPLADAWFDKDYWNLDLFMEAYLKKVSDLFQIKVTPASTAASTISRVNDSSLWDRKWVFCTEYGNNGTVTCYGNISKENWTDSNERFSQCKAEIINSVPDNQTAVPIRICTLDGVMNNFCAFIQQKKQEIYNLNCMAAGQCMDTAFLYNPSAYSISNEKFIVETVNDFYNNIDPTACSVSPTTQEIIDQNNQLRERCGSVQLVPLRDSISYLRRIVHSIVKITYYYYMIVFSFIQLLTPVEIVDTDSILSNIKVYLELLISESLRLFNQFGNFIFTLLEMTPFGKALMVIVKALCIAMKYVYEYFILIVICPLLKALAAYTSMIGNILQSIAQVSILGIKPFGWLPYKWAFGIRDIIQTFSPCSPNNPFQCDNLHSIKDKQGSGTLPTPTRCWASYVTSLGDPQTLSCQASDTCLKTITGSVSDTVVCAACPSGYDVASTNKFGCDLVRKQCACTVPIIDRTPCLTHEQCVNQQDSSCVFINSEIQQTFGNVPCNQCNNEPLCIIQPGDTYGYCSCTLKKIPFQTCDPAYEGQQVAYSTSGLCLAEMSSALSYSGGTSSAYTLKYNNLLATPCFNADASSLYCYRVYFTATDYQDLLVSQGTSSLSSYTGGVYGRRRLLEFDNERQQNVEFFSHDPSCMDEKDRYLASGNISRVFQRCLQSYASTLDITTAYGVQEIVPSNMFVSVEDFFTEMGNRPEAFVALLSNVPMMVRVIHQMHWFKPVRRIWKRLQDVILDLYMELVLSKHYYKDRDMFEVVIDADGYQVLHNNKTSFHTLFLINFIHGMGRLKNYTSAEHEKIEMAVRNRQTMDVIKDVVYDRSFVLNAVLNSSNHSSNHSSRTLKQYGFERQEVARFSSTVGFNDGLPAEVGLQTANDWSRSYFAWPLTFDYKITNGVCSVLSRFIVLVKNAFGNASLYYTQGSVMKMTPRKSIRGSFPFNDYVPSSTVFNREPLNSNDYFQVISYWVEDRLASFGFTRQFVIDQSIALPGFLVNLTVCDNESVMLCTKHRYTIYVSGVVIGLTYLGISIVCRLLGIPFIDTFLFWSYPFMVMFYAYGYSPFCIPMIPTCLVEDILSLIDWILPERIVYPNALQTSSGCIDNVNITNKETCIRSCQSYGFEYVGVDANIAWYLCSYSVDTCRSFRDWYNSQTVIPKFIPRINGLSRLISQKALIIESRSNDMIVAQDICALLTLWKFIPVFLIISFAFFFSLFIIGLPFQILGGFIQLLIGVIVVSHQ